MSGVFPGDIQSATLCVEAARGRANERSRAMFSHRRAATQPTTRALHARAPYNEAELGLNKGSGCRSGGGSDSKDQGLGDPAALPSGQGRGSSGR